MYLPNFGCAKGPKLILDTFFSAERDNPDAASIPAFLLHCEYQSNFDNPLEVITRQSPLADPQENLNLH